jgi:ABC-type bacteriocin/lantibiotic exporter with double-glycine peptidase domain
MLKKLTIPYHKQNKDHTCGPASLRMVLEFLGIIKTENELEKLAETVEEGTTPEKLSNAAKSLGLHCYIKSPSSEQEVKNIIDSGLPVIVSYFDTDELHYTVLVGYDENKFYFNDPWNGDDPVPEMEIEKFIPLWYDRDNLEKWIMVLSKVKLELGNTEEVN